MDEEGWQSSDIPPPCNGVWQIKKSVGMDLFFFYAKYEDGKWGWAWNTPDTAKEKKLEERDDFNFVWRGKQKDEG